MGVGKKYRGKIEKAFIQYVTDRLKDRDDIDLRRIFITDSGISSEARAAIEEAVLSCQSFEKVYHTLSGCTISGHCGPWCMGILYYHK
jgi:fatty acid-binding protein DegV